MSKIEFKDYYRILNVPRNATDYEIKYMYRKLALERHPDRNRSKDAEEKFKEITEAHSILSDEGKRALYDCYLAYIDLLERKKWKHKQRWKEGAKNVLGWIGTIALMLFIVAVVIVLAFPWISIIIPAIERLFQ